MNQGLRGRCLHWLRSAMKCQPVDTTFSMYWVWPRREGIRRTLPLPQSDKINQIKKLVFYLREFWVEKFTCFNSGISKKWFLVCFLFCFFLFPFLILTKYSKFSILSRANISYRQLTWRQSYLEQYFSFQDSLPHLQLNLIFHFNMTTVTAKTICIPVTQSMESNHGGDPVLPSSSLETFFFLSRRCTITVNLGI